MRIFAPSYRRNYRSVGIIAPRGVLAKCARYPTRRCVIELRNDLTLIEYLSEYGRAFASS